MIAANKNSLGFTLVEVLVAMVILSLTFMSLLGLSNTSVKQAIYNRDNTMAVTLARHRMELLTMMVKKGQTSESSFDSGSELDYGFAEMVEEDYPQFEIEDEINPVMDLPFEIPDGIELVRITVTVRWNTGLDQEQEFTLESYAANYASPVGY